MAVGLRVWSPGVVREGHLYLIALAWPCTTKQQSFPVPFPFLSQPQLITHLWSPTLRFSSWLPGMAFCPPLNEWLEDGSVEQRCGGQDKPSCRSRETFPVCLERPESSAQHGGYKIITWPLTLRSMHCGYFYKRDWRKATEVSMGRITSRCSSCPFQQS